MKNKQSLDYLVYLNGMKKQSNGNEICAEAENICHFKQGSEGRHWAEVLFEGRTGHKRGTC